MVTSAWMIYYLNFNWNKGKTSKLNKYEKIFTINIIKKINEVFGVFCGVSVNWKKI